MINDAFFALLQVNPLTGVPGHNSGLLLRAAHEAARRATGHPLLCLAPELALSGPVLESLPGQEGFLSLCRRELFELAAELANGPEMVLGCPEQIGSACFSSLFLLKGGKPTRLCTRPLEDSTAYGLARRSDTGKTPSGSFIWQGAHFTVVPGPLRTAITVPQTDVLLIADNEPFEPARLAAAERACSDIARKNACKVLRVNTAGGQGSFVFPGGSLAADAEGGLRLRAGLWREAAALASFASLDNPVQAAPAAHSSPAAQAAPAAQAVPPAPDRIDALGHALILGIRDFVRKSGFSRVVLGMSGGIDSSLVACLAAEALGAENVMGLLMPSPWSSQGSLDDASALASNLGIASHVVPIEPLMKSYAETLAPLFAGRPKDITEENIQARIRANLLMACSNKFGSMLLSTGNKSESAMGYGTLYGDLAGSLAPIADVYKTDVYRVAAWFNAQKQREIIPRNVFVKAPSAELKPGQKDQDSLPPYGMLDDCLRGLFEEGRVFAETAGSDALGAAAFANVLERLRRSEFKRHQGAPALFVSSCPLASFRRPLPAVPIQ
ncbi:MAG: NAD(+) synthase [Desulfovibrionaceae bacterium]|nr:NAD(+) synthase [Desulfovibrionaceae bacterium]